MISKLIVKYVLNNENYSKAYSTKKRKINLQYIHTVSVWISDTSLSSRFHHVQISDNGLNS